MLRFLLYSLVSSIMALALLASILVYHIAADLPSVITLKNIRFQVPLRIFTEDGFLIGEFGEKKRLPVTLDQVPMVLLNAIIATEDKRFREHTGVDWIGVLRAAKKNTSGKKLQGASTITMQVARNFFLSREKTYARKLRELILSLKIEKNLTKDEILELYVNKIFFGNHAYGVAAAAQVYYGATLDKLHLAQLAMIAGLPQKPSSQNPINDPKNSLRRRNHVLQRMFEEHYITQEEMQAAIAMPETAVLHKSRITLEAPYVAEMVRGALVKKYGEAAYTESFEVITTITKKHQNAANFALGKSLKEYDLRHGYRKPERRLAFKDNETTQHVLESLLKTIHSYNQLSPAIVTAIRRKSIDAYLLRAGMVTVDLSGTSWRRYINSSHSLPITDAAEIIQLGDVIRLEENLDGDWQLAQIPEAQGALSSMEPQSGKILSLVGGYNFALSHFNRVTQINRQPGSSFKPFVYSAAFAAGFSPASIILDAPIARGSFRKQGAWEPKNYNNVVHGSVTVRNALTFSYNLATIRLLDKIGIGFSLRHVAHFGLPTNKLPKNLSLALGDGALSLLELLNSYAVIANGGYAVSPYFIKRITRKGEVLFEKTPESQEMPPNNAADTLSDESLAVHAVDPRNVWLVQSLMRDVIRRGTGRRALTLGRKDLAGKTGTTNDQRDAWFFGFNHAIAAGAWVGFDDYRGLGRGETGSRAALPMWIEYMKIALDGVPEKIQPQPEGVVTVRVNKSTGLATNAEDAESRFDMFLEENAPAKTTISPARNEQLKTPVLPNQLF